MKPSSYFRIIEQQVYLDVNGPAQPSPEDVLQLRPLPPEELELYQHLKASARTDEQIYAEFVKRQAEARVSFELNFTTTYLNAVSEAAEPSINPETTRFDSLAGRYK